MLLVLLYVVLLYCFVVAEPWKIHRSVLARAFTHSSIESQVKIFQEYAKKLVYKLDESIAQQGCNEFSDCAEPFLEKAVAYHVLYIILRKNLIRLKKKI